MKNNNRKHNRRNMSRYEKELQPSHDHSSLLVDNWLNPYSYLEEDFDTFMPNIDIREKDSELCVLAELPGLDEKDIELSIRNNTLTIKG